MVGTAKYSDSEIVTAVEAAGGSIRAAAKALNCSQSTVRLRLSNASVAYGNEARIAEKESAPVTLPEFPDDDIPIAEIRSLMARRFEKRQANHKSKEWFPVKVNIDGPIGVTFWGDPHVDDDGCNWTLLNRHCDIHRANKALFSVNIGDTVNGWMNRLVHLYANQETSEKTARKLAEWFLTDAGIRWLCVLWGNHDLWSLFPEVMRAGNVAKVPMEDWQARFRLVFPNKREARVWAAHDFPGNSMWNSLQGPQKAAHTKSEAHIYACGHKHNWAMHQEESASRDFTYWLIRARGYKFIDSFGEKLGHMSQDEGASITCIFDPASKSEAGFIQSFADMDAASDYLGYLRKRK